MFCVTTADSFPVRSESGHEPVRRVGGYALAGVLLGEPLPVGLWVHGEEVDGQHLLQGNLPVLVVEALGAPEVGDPDSVETPAPPKKTMRLDSSIH